MGKGKPSLSVHQHKKISNEQLDKSHTSVASQFMSAGAGLEVNQPHVVGG